MKTANDVVLAIVAHGNAEMEWLRAQELLEIGISDARYSGLVKLDTPEHPTGELRALLAVSFERVHTARLALVQAQLDLNIDNLFYRDSRPGGQP